MILRLVLEDLLRLWHPFVPFVTEAIWGNFKDNTLLISEKWPRTEKYTEITGAVAGTNELNFEKIKSIISAIRNVRSEYKIEPSKKLDVLIYAGRNTKLIKSQEEIIKKLKTGIAELRIQEKREKISKAIYISIGGIEIYIPLEGLLDLEKEKTRLEKELQEISAFIALIKKKLTNKKFVDNAPKEIVQKEKTKLLSQKDKISKIKKYLRSLE